MSGRRITRLDSPGRRGFTVMIGLLLLLLPIVALGAVHAKRHAKGSRLVPVPRIRTGPPKHTTQTSARFTFTDSEQGVTFLCSLDGSSFEVCSSTQRYGPILAATRCPKHASFKRRNSKRTRSRPCKPTTKLTGGPLSQGPHTFRVRARRRGGRPSAPASYAWTIEAPAAPGAPVPSSPSPTTPPTSPTSPPPSPPNSPPYPVEGHGFSISTVGGGGELYPGGPPETIPLTLYNPNDEALEVTSLTVAVSKSPAGCDAATNLRLTQSNVSAEQPLIVPANGSATLPAQGVSAPTVQLLELPSNQDACKGVSFTLRYSGSGHS
jgi:hypothetical protein